MKKAEHKKMLFDTMRDEMRADRSKYTILPLSKFGLMQITRQRVRPEMNIVTREKCPTCDGKGTIQASILITDVIAENLDYILTKQNERGISITLHPYLHAYFTRGLISEQVKWWLKYKTWIKLIQDSSLGIMEFAFQNRDGEVIELS
jgi:ribonuclease G